MAPSSLYKNVGKISAFHNTVGLLDDEGWQLKVNIWSFENKFNLSHLYMWI